tara:strand:+ start:209 stop:469 length:261 start_codon:yes stop_codon:yes gene_type:complete
MIDSYRKHCIHKEMKPDGININLRAIKTLFNWCYKRELIEKNIFVDMVTTSNRLPTYIPDSIYNKFMQSKWFDERFETAFAFYYET